MRRCSYLAATLLALQAATAAWGTSFNVSSLTPTLFPGNDWNTIGPGLYKADSPNPASESGTDPNNLFTTTFTVVSSKVTGGTVTFDVPSSTLDIDFFVIKSGNEYARFDTSAVNWSLYDSIVFSGFTQSARPQNGPKSISHISIYGTYTPPRPPSGDPQPPTSVPDGGWTLGLLGAGAIGLLLKHRK